MTSWPWRGGYFFWGGWGEGSKNITIMIVEESLFVCWFQNGLAYLELTIYGNLLEWLLIQTDSYFIDLLFTDYAFLNISWNKLTFAFSGKQSSKVASKGCNFCGKVGMEPISNERTTFNYSCLEVKKKRDYKKGAKSNMSGVNKFF